MTAPSTPPPTLPQHTASRTPAGHTRVLVTLPMSVIDVHVLRQHYGVEPSLTITGALQSLVDARAPEGERPARVSALVTPGGEGLWADEVYAVAAALPRRRDARCPGCGQRVAAPDPLPAGWVCAGHHPSGGAR